MSSLPKTPAFSLSGKRALVTGGSSGIGLGCAVALAEAGAHVVCAARRAGPLEEAVGAIAAAGHSAEAQVLDQTNLGALETDGVEAQIHWGIRAPFLGQTGKLYVDSSIGWLNNLS